MSCLTVVGHGFLMIQGVEVISKLPDNGIVISGVITWMVDAGPD